MPFIGKNPLYSWGRRLQEENEKEWSKEDGDETVNTKEAFFFLETLIRGLGGERRHCTVLLLSHIHRFAASLLNSVSSQDAGKRGDGSVWGKGSTTYLFNWRCVLLTVSSVSSVCLLSWASLLVLSFSSHFHFSLELYFFFLQWISLPFSFPLCRNRGKPWSMCN